MTVNEWLRTASKRLKHAGIDSPRLDAEVMAAHILRVGRPWLFAHPEADMPELAGEALLARREHREPLSYIVGGREFYGRWFKATPAVLIPRQDTEVLVETALALPRGAQTVLDLGTGSGCIGITLALERPNWTVTASDISAAALALAEENAESLDVGVAFILSDGFEALTHQTFDLIVTNPPYIGTYEPLMPEVFQFEPHLALFAGETGYEFYERLAREAYLYLNHSGSLMMEVGYQQADHVAKLFAHEKWVLSGTQHDLSGIARVLTMQRA